MTKLAGPEDDTSLVEDPFESLFLLLDPLLTDGFFPPEDEDATVSPTSSSRGRVRMEEVTSHQIVLRSSLIKQMLQVGASGLGLIACLLLLDVSLAEDEVSSLDGTLSPDSRYPESSDDISPFLRGPPLRAGADLDGFSSTPDRRESDDDDCSSRLSSVRAEEERPGTLLLEAVAALAVEVTFLEPPIGKEWRRPLCLADDKATLSLWFDEGRC